MKYDNLEELTNYVDYFNYISTPPKPQATISPADLHISKKRKTEGMDETAAPATTSTPNVTPEASPPASSPTNQRAEWTADRASQLVMLVFEEVRKRGDIEAIASQVGMSKKQVYDQLAPKRANIRQLAERLVREAKGGGGK